MMKNFHSPVFALFLFAYALLTADRLLAVQSNNPSANVPAQLDTDGEKIIPENNLNPWLSAGAFTIPEKRVQVGLFQALRYGYSKNIEISSHPLIFFIMPNLEIKWRHKKFGAFYIATRHSVFYPTLLLRTLSRQGTGGFISPEFNIPHMFALYNELIGTIQFTRSHFFSIRGGVAVSVKFGGLDRRTSIDLPLIYHRLDVFYSGYQLRLGSNLQGTISGRWKYLIDVDFFFSLAKENSLSFEHKGLILWNKSKTFQITLGYKLVYGNYPFGTQWHLLLPLFDIQKAWSRN